jgi:hypothetical protein
MRCYCCNNSLSGAEAVRKFKESGAFTDMCDRCLSEIREEGLETVEGEAEDEQLFDEDGNPVE